jgi:hypothetical protein
MMFAKSFAIKNQSLQLHLHLEHVRYERTSFERNCD